MCAEAERDVVIVGAGHVELVGSLEHPLVAIGRRVHEQHLVADSQLLSVEGVVFGDRATHVEDGGDPANELLDTRVAEDGRVVEELLALLGPHGELTYDRTDHRARGLGAAVEQQDALRQDLLVGPGPAVDLGADPCRDEIVPGVRATLGDDAHGDAEEIGDGAADLDAGLLGIHAIWWGLARLVHGDLGPLAHLGPQLARIAELLTDHDRRKWRRQHLDRVARACRGDGIDELGHDAAHMILDLLHRTRRELTGHDHALALVIGVVAVDHGGVGALVGARS